MRTASATVRRSFCLAIVCGVLLTLAPAYADPTDVCSLRGAALNEKVTKGAAEIADAYAAAKSQLSLSGGPCEWTCGSARIITPVVKAFGLLQYNCSAPAKQMGLSIPDADYHAAADKVFRSGSSGVGDLMRVPPWLVSAAQDGSVKKLTDAIAKVPGAAWMRFSSTSVLNDKPPTAARIIIRVPDTKTPPRFEQWIQIAINKAGELDRNVDFLAVQLETDPASPLNDDRPVVVAFRGFSRTPQGFVREGPGSDHPLTKCYSCHPTGIRAVIPAGTQAAADGGPGIKPDGTIPLTGPGNITAITDPEATRRALFGPVGYNTLENGPPFGPSKRSGRAEFVEKGCGAGLGPPRREAIVANMDCQKCHDGETDRGLLNAGTSIRTIRHKVVENTAAPMPPSSVWADKPALKLSAAEREILFKCLQAEYAEMLRGWLTSDLLMVP